METHIIELQNINSGALEGMFQRELRRVIDNIQDENTDAERKRVITLKVEILPEVDRSAARVITSAESRVAPCIAIANHLYITRKGVVQQDLQQQDIFAENVEEFKKERKES